MPGVFTGVRTQNEPIPEGERVFMMASDRLAMETGDIPIRLRHFPNNEKKGG